MTSLDAGDRVGVALGWFLGLLVLPWFWMAHGVLRVCEWSHRNESVARVGAVVYCVVLGATLGCVSASRESQRSRDINECVYQVQYVGPKLPPAVEAAVIKRCRE